MNNTSRLGKALLVFSLLSTLAGCGPKPPSDEKVHLDLQGQFRPALEFQGMHRFFGILFRNELTVNKCKFMAEDRYGCEMTITTSRTEVLPEALQDQQDREWIFLKAMMSATSRRPSIERTLFEAIDLPPGTEVGSETGVVIFKLANDTWTIADFQKGLVDF